MITDVSPNGAGRRSRAEAGRRGRGGAAGRGRLAGRRAEAGRRRAQGRTASRADADPARRTACNRCRCRCPSRRQGQAAGLSTGGPDPTVREL